MKLNTYNTTGKKLAPVEASDQLFAGKINSTVLARYIRVFLSRQRQSSGKTKTRAQVLLTGAKVWRQKGTGRARHGSRRAPIFVGGGKAHGPRGDQNYKLSLSKTQKRQALISALTTKSTDALIITDIDKQAKTKDIQQALNKVLNWDGSKSATIVLSDNQSPVIKASNNLSNCNTTQAARINPYEIINSDNLIFTKESLQKLSDTFLKTDKSSEETTKATAKPKTATKKESKSTKK